MRVSNFGTGHLLGNPAVIFLRQLSHYSLDIYICHLLFA